MRKLLTIILMITILTGCSVSSDLPTETSVTDETTTHARSTENPDFLYRINNDDVRIITYLGNESSVLIPSSIENHPVKAVQNIILKECVTELTYAEGITEITVPIGKSLKKINLPSTLEIIHIGENSNYHATIEVNISNNNKFMSKGGVLFSADEKTLIYYPCGRTGSYMIPDGTEIIGDNAFLEALVENVTFPESIKEIGKYAFKYCSKLISISFPKSLDKIGENAFYSSGLNNVEFSEGVKEIGSYAFAETNLDEIVLPSSLKTVGNNICGDADEEITIYADTPTESLEPLDCYENLIYRNDTMLKKAIRLGKRMIEQKSFYDCPKTLLFTDIDGDDFPELFTNYSAYCYKYSEKSGWQEFISCYGEHNNINLYYDKENNSYFFVNISDMYEAEYYCQAEKITFDSNNKIITDSIATSSIFYPIGSYIVLNNILLKKLFFQASSP